MKERVPAGRLNTQALGVIEGIAVSSSTSHTRHGQGSVRPYLLGPVDLPEFLQQVFGAVELERFEFGPKSFHVELRIEDATVVVEAGDLPPNVERQASFVDGGGNTWWIATFKP